MRGLKLFDHPLLQAPEHKVRYHINEMKKGEKFGLITNYFLMLLNLGTAIVLMKLLHTVY
jgi:hypothetical protein